MRTRVDLDVEVRVEGDGASVAYTFRNGTDADLFVYAHPDDGTRTALLPGAYTLLSGDRERLNVLLGIPPEPRHHTVFRGVLPLARVVAAGRERRGLIELPLPIREWTGYGGPECDDCALVEVVEGAFSMEYFPTESALFVEDGPEPGTFWTTSGDNRRVTAGFAFPRPVEVAERPQPFARF